MNLVPINKLSMFNLDPLRPSRKRLLFLASIVFLGGCAVGPDYTEPQTDAPASFYGLSDEQKTEQTALIWWTGFNDEALNELISRIADNNLTLEAARAKLLQARAMRNIATGGYYPNLNAMGSIIRQQQSKNGLMPVLSGEGFPPGLPGRTETQFKAGFDASWEVDLFGKTRRTVQAANATLAKAEYEVADLANTLRAEAGQAYLHCKTSNQLLELLERNIAIRKETLDLAEARLDAGAATELDVARARSALTTLQAQRAPLQTERDGCILGLSILTNLEPAAVQDILSQSDDLPYYRGPVGVGLPSDLLKRRPDIRAAERNLAAATATVGSAKADLYPRFSLFGSLGWESLELGDFAEKASNFWRVGPQLTLPVFQGNRLRSTVQMRRAQVDEALAMYKNTILQALRDVEMSAMRVRRAREQTADLSKAREAAERAYELASVQYKAGTLPLDQLLQVESELINIKEHVLKARSNAEIQVIGLGKALGGGWTVDDVTELPRQIPVN